MATTLDVVNSCLATMGETPLNAITEPHSYKGAAVKALNEANKRLQASGWWFNTEAITLAPAPVTGHLQLPTDCIGWRSQVRTRDTLVRQLPKPWLVLRGSRLYDTRSQSYTHTESVVGELTRLIPFEDLPPTFSDYVAAEAVLRFQSNFDADNSKRGELNEALRLARIAANAENTRQASVNLLNNSVRLTRIKSVTRGMRYST